MDVSKKTLHKIHSRRNFIEKTDSKLRKSEAAYNKFQHKKEHLYDEKKPWIGKRFHNTLTKPYELQYHITRSTDSSGKEVYKQGFRFAEASHHAHQRGVLHKIDDMRRYNLKSDVKGLKTIPHVITHTRPARIIGSAAHRFAETSAGSEVVNTAHKAADTKIGHGVTKTLRYSGNAAYKTVSLGAEGAFRTGLAAETTIITVGDTVKNRSKATLESKVRQDAQGDADKAGILIATNTAAASKALVKHIHNKHHYKPLQKNLTKQIRNSRKSDKADRYTHSQNKRYIKAVEVSNKLRNKTGRERLPGENMQYILSKKQKSKLTYKADKKEYKSLKKVFKHNPSVANEKQLHLSKQNLRTSRNTYKVQKNDIKLTKLRNKNNKAQLKLYKLKNRSLASKAAAGLTVKFEGSLRNLAMKNGAADNDAVMAMDKFCTISRRVMQKKPKDVKINKTLKKYSRREESLHKKSAKKKKKITNRNKTNYNAKEVYKQYAAKKARNAIRRRKASRFGLVVVGILTPIIILPLILVSCLGIFVNPGNFGFITGYYGAKEYALTQASEYYQKLAYDMNEYVLSVPDEWKDRLSDLNIPADYSDEPTRFVFGNSGSLASDTTYDFDKHKLYSYLCAFLLTKDEEGAIKNWKFNDEVKQIIEDLFFDEYEFKAVYDNSSHWELKHSYEWSGYFLIEGCGWNGTYGYIDISYPDALPIQNVMNENTLYFNVENGEILDYNKGYAATGYYLQNQYYTDTDSAGNVYAGYLDGEECTYGIYENGVLTIPFYYVIPDERWISIIHRYDRINECTLYYSVNRKNTFDDVIKNSLMTLEAGESLYSYYMTLSPNTEPRYYGMHQLGTSPVYNGYVGLLENNLIGHGFGWEMKGWNQEDCLFNSNGKEHSGISIIQNSGSDVYAMVNGTILYVEDNFFILLAYPKDRDNYLKLLVMYCNVDTSGLEVGQKVQKGEVISHVTNRRQEIKYEESLGQYLNEYTFDDLETIDNDCGYDYLNITCYDTYSYTPNTPYRIIDPEIILSLSDKGENSETEEQT